MRVGFIPRLLSSRLRARMVILIISDRPFSPGPAQPGPHWPVHTHRQAALVAVWEHVLLPYRRKAAPGTGHGLQNL